MTPSALAVTAAGIDFQNPVLLAAGTAAYGRELARVIDLDVLGGLVTKAVSVERRHGARAPRVAEFEGGMINAVGLANPGVDEVRSEHLPWLANNLHRAKVLVNVVGNQVEEFASVVEILDESPAVSGYELNVSCPNVKAGGMEFGADARSLSDVVSRARRATRKAIFVKLSPTLQDIGQSAKTAADAGADGISVVQYLIAGASLVAIGTAAMQEPRLPAKIIDGLEAWCRKMGVTSLSDIRGSLEWEG